MENLIPLAAVEGSERRVLSQSPPNAEAPPGAFAHLLTPASDRFVRCHFEIPRLEESHHIEIKGAVAQARRVSMPELRAMPALAATILTECAGNNRTSFDRPIDGEPWDGGAISTAQWTGVPLRSLLELKDKAVEVVFTGADGGEYRRSLPREVALDGGTLVAYEMNGEPIPAMFGGPVRLVVPGWYGMASVKWLGQIEAVERPFEGKFQTERYVYGPGQPVTRIRIKSMFTALPAIARAGSPLRITGLAWGGEGVARVEICLSGAWREATLVGPVLPCAWRRFELQWTPPAAGRYRLRCRATDERGECQPDQPRENPLGYGANAVQEAELVVA